MKTRSHESEILDDPNVPPEELLASLNFMRQVNQLLGGCRVILDYLEAHETPDEFSFLDVACGAGDIAFAVAEWAKSRGKNVSVTGIDLNPLCITYASRHFQSPALRFLERSAFAAEKLGEFDYIASSMFFHHLDDGQIVALLKSMRRQARRGFIVNDLYRGWLNYWGAFVLGVFSFRPIVFHDAKLSVKRAFKEEDFKRYRELSGMPDLKIERKPVFRLAMSRHV